MTEKNLKALAEKFNLMSGKWILQVPWDSADEDWGKLVRGLLEGKFADDLGVLSVVVHGRELGHNPHGDDAYISVETDDWTLEEKAMEVAKVIRSLGITYDLDYKMSVYSTLNILRTNPFNVRPTIYHSVAADN